MRGKRRELTCEEVSEKSRLIEEKLFSLECMKNAKNICTFISSFKEPDTWGIIKRLWKTDCGVIVPISDMTDNTLSLSYIDSETPLKKGAYGILEPSEIKAANIDDIDIILVPGLAFDRSGGRMGFGKGYYDRLLCESDAKKIGLCYDFQVFDKIPSESHDVPMDFIVTEKEILR